MGASFKAQNNEWQSVLQSSPSKYDNGSFGQTVLNWLSTNGSKLAQINDDNGIRMSRYKVGNHTNCSKSAEPRISTTPGV